MPLQAGRRDGGQDDGAGCVERRGNRSRRGPCRVGDRRAPELWGHTFRREREAGWELLQFREAEFVDVET